MLLSNKCQYALRAALYLANHQNDGLISIKEISEKLDISFHFLTKILQQLTNEQIIESQKGPKGGVKLTTKGLNIRLYDLVDIMDGVDLFHECVLGLPGCGHLKPCVLHEEWAMRRENLKEMLQGLTLEKIADSSSVIHRLTMS